MTRGVTRILRHAVFGISGLSSFIFIALNLSFWIIPVAVLALVKLLMPIPRIKRQAYRTMAWIYGAAVRINDFLLFRVLNNRLVCRNIHILEKDRNYLVLSNHRSWADILILQSLLNGKTPPIQFIVKRELIFIPLIGLICWAYEYPFVRRGSLKSAKGRDGRTARDMHAIRRKMGSIRTSGLSIINFVEGTRFNILKSEKYAHEFKYLLNPRAGGLFHILKNYGEKLDTILDFTIVYGCRPPVFWKFLGGRCRKIIVDLKIVPMGDLLTSLCGENGELGFRSVSTWLGDLWREKDEKMGRLACELEGNE